ncbi:MAG: DUF6055 domain-containing protein [Bacteroidales bacterium]|nr:DUF6055 domain-containing protein [Bacteroidales bacterium]
MNADGKGWYRIATEKAPQNYGYNGIRLEVPEHQQNSGRSLADPWQETRKYRTTERGAVALQV